MLNSLYSAFQMYSRIPTPKVKWSDENRRYSLCFFPLIGAVICVTVLLWHFICDLLAAGDLMYGAGVFAAAVFVTGGIHLDGFCDTCDARASWGDRQKKLAILSDSHIGAFAAIRLSVYVILYVAIMSELRELPIAAGLGCVLSRALSGYAAVSFKAAKKEGTLQSFSVPADKKTTAAVLLTTAVLSCLGLMFFSLEVGAAFSLAAMLSIIYYRHMAYKEFGGITGDLEGWFLQICELSTAAAAAIVYRITEVL